MLTRNNSHESPAAEKGVRLLPLFATPPNPKNPSERDGTDVAPEASEDAKPSRRPRLRPHVEAHGLYSIEWSYHFPLSPGFRIESQLDLDFPGEKVPGAARTSLRDANLSTTRLSFADSASAVRGQSLKFLKDSLWLLAAARAEREGKDPRYVRVSDADRSFLHVAREYWTTPYFARLGVILQSDLKAGRNSLREIIRARALEGAVHDPNFSRVKGELLQSFRSALRLVRARLVWEKLLTMERESQMTVATEADVQLSLRFVQQVKDLSELSLALVSGAVAELQTAVSELLRHLVEQLAMLRSSHVEAPHQDEDYEARLVKLEVAFRRERKWLAEWARLCNDMRLLCGLPSLVDIAADASLAATYFERVRQLKKQHYHVWDLDLDLKPNDQRIDFWIGAGAAGISAFFAFLALILFNLNRNTMGEQGLVALLVFALANSVIYIAKDRLKEWLKVNLRTVLNLRFGRWTGECKLRRDGNETSVGEGLEVAQMERETWWSEEDENWTFHVWEEFRVLPEAAGTDARIVKQVWRLPLDEILHTLDNTRHILKIPSPDGEPREVPVLKHAVFPFRLRVRVKSWQQRRVDIVDTAYVVGRVHTAGDHIIQVEITDESA